MIYLPLFIVWSDYLMWCLNPYLLIKKSKSNKCKISNFKSYLLFFHGGMNIIFYSYLHVFCGRCGVVKSPLHLQHIAYFTDVVSVRKPRLHDAISPVLDWEFLLSITWIRLMDFKVGAQTPDRKSSGARPNGLCLLSNLLQILLSTMRLFSPTVHVLWFVIVCRRLAWPGLTWMSGRVKGP